MGTRVDGLGAGVCYENDETPPEETVTPTSLHPLQTFLRIHHGSSTCRNRGAHFLHAKVVDADEDGAVFEYTVQPEDRNFTNNFHGGAIAALIDNLSTAAMFTRERKHFLMGGVSTDLHVTYVGASTVGDVLLVECRATKVGAGLANLSTTIRDKKSGRVIATSTHTKFNTDSRYAPGSRL
ncbi:hypothetical protein BGW38_009284 [Lunasporangiospora selenospora]|uniref:Thioesterase domain-containing protein n=1 Tax=Lunasporangiospora selenospora TaxID=979761 RepID=A0A9P6FXZ7_9FUNG|nr:hypothetical protein BGW38_009284 [Lunasporangiospora selenospora]